MKANTAGLLLVMLLAAACGREQTNSDGNGPGNADGAGGRADPPMAPANDLGVPPPSGEDSATAPTQPPAQPQ